MDKPTTVKKGRKAWRPADVLGVKQKPGISYRWVRKDALHIAKKRQEGYVMANEVTGTKAELKDDRAAHGHTGAPDTVIEYNDMVLMALDDETKKARDEYFEEQVLMQSTPPGVRARKDANDAGFDIDEGLIYDVSN